jgi:hypothetical protein
MTYRDLNYSPLGIRTIATYVRDTPAITRASAQPGSVIADGVNVSSVNLKIDKDGIYLGTAVPAYEEGRLYYDFVSHALKVGGQSTFETVTSTV